MPEELVTATLHSQMRFYAVWFMPPFFITIWIVRNQEIAEPSMIGASAVEIRVLQFIPWRRVVMNRQRAQALA